MIIYKEQQTTTTVPESIVCDRCQRAIHDYESLVEIRHEFGYGTENDGDFIEADICETCIFEVLRISNIKFRKYECTGEIDG